MAEHHFISYSRTDGQELALRLHDALSGGSAPVPVWLDQHDLKAVRDWDDPIDEAIRSCASLLFVMTNDSVESHSVCKEEWGYALKCKKPVIPILLHRDAKIPMRLVNRQFLDFTGSFEPALARLRDHLFWLASPLGVLQAMKDRLADTERDLRRPKDSLLEARIREDITLLKKQIAEQEGIVADPEGAAKRVEESIARGLERERHPERPVGRVVTSRFINPPPGLAPVYFQDRHVETKLIGDFLKDDSRRLMTVVGRGGVGKTAMVCRLLKALEGGQLPDDGGPLPVDGIVYLSATGTRRVTMPNLYADLAKLLPSDTAEKLDALYRDPHVSTEAKMEALVAAFPHGRTILLLDNFEDVIDLTTLEIRDAELDECLKALLCLSQHAVKVIVTTRAAARHLALVQPARQTRIDVDDGLPSPYAENILREMDIDGKVGLKSAPQSLLDEARERTRGYPRALEALFALLSADRDTDLQDVLNQTAKLLPENVVEVLVGEAFSRLEPVAQRVMQSLAICARPVTPTAVDYLLQPHLSGVNSAPVLNRLVNMQFARKEGGAYYLHPIDREYALSQVSRGQPNDRTTEPPPFTQVALQHRAAEYFKKARLPRADWKRIEDLTPQLAEFELRCAGEDYDTAARVFSSISWDYLFVWGFDWLMIELSLQLHGKLSDPELKDNYFGTLGSAYARVGLVERAIECLEQALAIARERNDRESEARWLGNLGNRYDELGQTKRSIGYHEEALAISCETANRHSEIYALGNLGIRFAQLGQLSRAIEYLEQVLSISREIKDRFAECIALGNLSECLADDQQNINAMQQAKEAARIAAEIRAPEQASCANAIVAIIHLNTGDLPAARAAAEAARQHDSPRNNHRVLADLGVIALRQQDPTAARDAFTTAVAQADIMLARNVQDSWALDSKALGLCGLALCEDRQGLSAAIEAYRKARAINKDAGSVARVLRIFDALAVADSAGILAEARRAAAGE